MEICEEIRVLAVLGEKEKCWKIRGFNTRGAVYVDRYKKLDLVVGRVSLSDPNINIFFICPYCLSN